MAQDEGPATEAEALSHGGPSSVIAILGLGLIGGSLALALKRSSDRTPTVVGWDQDRRAIGQALERRAIDRAAGDAAEAARGADIVVVAVPVLAARAIFQQIASALRPEALVTDVGSTKAEICSWAAETLGHAFVGGHPMAGSERSGIEHARPDLFDRATYCLTPSPSTPAQILQQAVAFVRLVGARAVIMSPATHDRAVAAASHLPFLLSTVLVDVTASDQEWDTFRAVAATGFRDVSRLASGDPRMHRDICVTNAEAIRPWLLRTAERLASLADLLDDPESMLDLFERAKRHRDAFLTQAQHSSSLVDQPEGRDPRAPFANRLNTGV